MAPQGFLVGLNEQIYFDGNAQKQDMDPTAAHSLLIPVGALAHMILRLMA